MEKIEFTRDYEAHCIPVAKKTLVPPEISMGDIRYLDALYELQKAAWSCKGFLTGKQTPFPGDIINKKLADDLRYELTSIFLENARYDIGKGFYEAHDAS